MKGWDVLVRVARSTPAAGVLPVALLFALGLLACDAVELPGDDVACAGVQCTAGTCFSNAGQPMCRCGPWEQAAGVTCAVAVFTQPDDHGGSPDSATALTLPMSPREGHIGEGVRQELMDRDLFALTVRERGTYLFSCTRLTLPDCRVRLLDADGNARPMPSVNEGATDSWFPSLSAGTWYFEVSGAGSTGRYRYHLALLDPDDHANDREGATVLAEGTGTPFPVRHSTRYDTDVFTFRSRPGHGYRFVCEPPPGLLIEVVLTTASGEAWDAAEGSSGSPVAVALLADSGRDWFVEVRARGGLFPGDSRCRFWDLGPDEHGDTLATATPVTPGVPVNVTLQSRDDVDVFAFTGEPGHAYTLRTEPPGRWSAQVVDAAGANVAASTTEGLRARVERAGTYYLRIEGEDLWAHAFSLTLVDAGLDDHGDSPETATHLVPGTSVTGRFETPQDTDAIAFLAEARGIYLASYAPFPGLSVNHRGASSSLGLGDGRHLFSARDAAFVTLMFQPLDGAEGFSLQVEQVAVDDHGDYSQDAQVLSLPAEVSGVVQTAVDADVFSVWLDAGRAYRLGLDIGTLELTLVAPGGAPWRPQAGVFSPERTGTHLLSLAGASGLAHVPWRFTLQEE